MLVTAATKHDAIEIIRTLITIDTGMYLINFEEGCPGVATKYPETGMSVSSRISVHCVGNLPKC